MATQLQIVNSVLRRLREPTVTSILQNDYALLIADLVNEAKREVEDAWDWLPLRKTIAVDTVSGVFKYTLTGAGNRWRLLRDYSTHPVGWDVINNTKDYNLVKAPSALMTRWLTDNNVQHGDPYYFDINGQSGGDPQVDLYPVPASQQRLHFNLIVPQPDFALDGTDHNTSLLVPDWPVILKAYALALTERGESGGATVVSAETRAEEALRNAIDNEIAGVPEEVIARIR